MTSRVFGSRGPRRPHLVNGPSGIGAEVRDLRTDTEAAFLQMEEEGATNVVVWAPFSPPAPEHYTEWADVVAAIQKLKTPTTTIHIVADPEGPNVVIPAGNWVLNNTTIVGKAVGANTDNTQDAPLTTYRGYQDLLNLRVESTDTTWCTITGCVGLKDIYFRGNGYPYTVVSANFTTPNPGDTVEVVVLDAPTAMFKDGDVVYIEDDILWNYIGYYKVMAGGGTTVLTLKNLGYAENAPGGVAVSNGSYIYPNSAVFNCTGWYTDGTEFTLDNTDFRYGNYLFGSFYVQEDAGLFLHMKGNASLRWYALRCDGYAAIQSEGGSPWIGYYAFVGDGSVDVFASSGMNLRSTQDGIASWWLYQGFTAYTPNDWSQWVGDQPASVSEALDRLATTAFTPGNSGDWAPDPPTTLKEAINRLAAAVKLLGGNP